MPRTRSFGEPLLPLNLEPQQIERMIEQQEADRLAVLARAQVNMQNVGQLARLPNPEDEDLGDEELMNPSNPRRVEQIAAPVQCNVNRNSPFWERQLYQPVQYDLNDYDDGIDGAGEMGAIFPPPLAPGVKFNITSTMI